MTERYTGTAVEELIISSFKAACQLAAMQYEASEVNDRSPDSAAPTVRPEIVEAL